MKFFPCAGRTALALTAALAFAPTAHAGTDRWTPFGPGDGALQSLVASSRGDLYVTTSDSAGEIWQRPVGATRWRWRGQGLGRLDGTRPVVIAVHPKNPNVLWAVALESAQSGFQTVFRSTDAGASWLRLFRNNGNFEIVRLTPATTRDSVVLFAETGGGGGARRLWRGTDFGAAWTEVPGVLGPIAGPPDEPDIVYAVAESGGGLLKSTNGGRRFRPVGALPIAAGDEIVAIHATYGRPALILVSLRSGGLYRSTNGGASFRAVGFARTGGPSALASEPGAPQKIYAIDSAFLYSSDRGGAGGSFRELATFAPDPVFPEPDALVAAPGGPYFLARGDLFRFSPPDRFAPVDKGGIEAYRVQELRISAQDPSFVSLRREIGCLPVCDVRTLLSTDGGLTFSRLGAQIAAHRFSDVLDLAFDPADPRRRLTIGPVGIELTEPGGRRIVRFGLEGTVEIAADGLLLAGGPNGIFWSENDGVTWTAGIDGVVPPSPEHPLGGTRRFLDLETNPYAPDRVIAHALEFTSGLPHDAGDTVLYKSVDAGRTWTTLRDGEADVEFVPGAPASFYLLFGTGSGTQLRRSDDFGTSSSLIHTFPASDFASDVATDPSGSGDLYLATRLGVRRSRDGGATWEATAGGWNPFGPYRRWVGKVQVAPDGRVIAAPLDGGLFENRLSN